MKRSITHQGITLEYEFTPKRVKNINLRVRPDGSVALSAPRWVTKGQVEEFLLARWAGVLAAQKRSVQRSTPAFDWQQGQSFHLLGQPVTVAYQEGKTASACLRQDTLLLTLPDPAKAAAVGERWYDSFCREQLALLEEQAVETEEVAE